MRFAEISLQINPLALRRNLNFLVTPDVCEIGSDENFSHIQVPKFVRYLGSGFPWASASI
jgi:hypothetical protein